MDRRAFKKNKKQNKLYHHGRSFFHFVFSWVFISVSPVYFHLKVFYKSFPFFLMGFIHSAILSCFFLASMPLYYSTRDNHGSLPQLAPDSQSPDWHYLDQRLQTEDCFRQDFLYLLWARYIWFHSVPVFRLSPTWRASAYLHRCTLQSPCLHSWKIRFRQRSICNNSPVWFFTFMFSSKASTATKCYQNITKLLTDHCKLFYKITIS